MTNEQTMRRMERKEEDSQSKMLTGSAWMSSASIISRLLGALYIVPWMNWIGDSSTANAANALYNVGYIPYALFLSIATAGVPSAIAKQVSYYNSLGEYQVSRNIYKRGLQVMSVTGLISGILMYVLAPSIAAGSPVESIEDGVQVIRTLSVALLLIPTMSVTRGYIQGYQTMAPSAISQVIEQVVRVVFMLGSVYLIRQVFDGSVADAVSMSTFGAFVGALASMGYLLYIIWKRQLASKDVVTHSRNKVSVSTNQILFSIVKTAIPFVIVGASVTVGQLIDQFTYDPIMTAKSDFSPAEILQTYGIASANANKLIMIVLSFGSSMAITSVPLISSLVGKKDYRGLSRQFSNSLQLLALIMVPAAFGIAAVAEPLYTSFYGHDAFGTSITRLSAYMVLFLGLHTILGSMMLAANKQRKAIIGFTIVLLVKLALQYPLVAIFKTHGMLLATMIAFGVSSVYMIWEAHKTAPFNIKLLAKRILLMVIFSMIMYVPAALVRRFLYLFIPESDRVLAVVIVGIVAALGLAAYGYLILKSKLADKVIGTRAATLRRKLKI